MEERDDFVTVSISGPEEVVTRILDGTTERPSDEGPNIQGVERLAFEYVDENSRVIYRVERASCTGRGGFEEVLFDDIIEVDQRGSSNVVCGRLKRRVPYCLDRLLAAAARSGCVAICNGERIATKINVGYPRAICDAATTFLEGLSGWRDEYAQYFKGVGEVIVVADPERAEKFAKVFEPAVKGLVGKVSYRTEEEMGVA